jgi:GT2 family glycosyltransferase
VAFIDDDVQIDSRWYTAVGSVFQDPGVDFAGGKTLPDWSQPPPDWLPPTYCGVVAWIDGGDQVREFGVDYDGILAGHNAVIRRRVLDRLGNPPYPTCVGRSGKGLLTADEDFYFRLLQTGARGLYVPDLIVYHYVSPSMLTKRYHRRWCFWNSVSHARLGRKAHACVPFLFGAPRWYYREALTGLVDWLKSLGSWTGPAQGMAGQLNVIRLLGFLYGKYFHWR